ncbi:MAG: hypothetical protein HY591_02650 [Candidatus Omnitrophica bacterium]|nr:hypothetical protein [Candidatus Omnitrophota bacterium]
MSLKQPFYISLKPFLDHQVLPRPTPWPQVFGNDRPVEVEIGFGNGEYLARLAQENPLVNYIGFEEYCERISRALRKLSRVAADNVRVMRLDVRPGFMYLFAPRAIRFIHCLFPPPWPKKSDAKHRLWTRGFLRLANNRLADNGAMRIVTDHEPYAEWIEEQVSGSGFDLKRARIPARYGTKFERKWVEGGQKEFDAIVLTKKEHIHVARKEDSPLNHYTIAQFDPDNFQMENFSAGGIAVVFKDFLYDPRRQTAQAHVLVYDEHLLQNVRIVIFKSGDEWRVHLARGSMLMPTPGIARALECVRDAAMKTHKGEGTKGF